MPNAIEIRDLVYSWPGRDEAALQVSDFSISRGASVFLFGTSGSGKSTLLNIVAGLTSPQSGSVTVLGHDMLAMNARARDRFRAERIGLIFQQFNLVPYLDVLTNIRIASHLGGTAKKEGQEEILLLLDSLLLDRSVLHRRADELSVGQQQRVAIARAMINRPELIIADEPTSALDEESRDEFIETLLTTQRRTSATVILVSHDRSLARFFDSTESMKAVNIARSRGYVNSRFGPGTGNAN